MDLRRGTSQAILAFAGLCAHEGIDCFLLYIALLGLQCVLVLNSILLTGFTVGLFSFLHLLKSCFLQTFPFGGFFRGFTNLTLVNCIYIFFLSTRYSVRDILLHLHRSVLLLCRMDRKKRGGTVCPYLGSDSVKRSGRVCLS